LRHINNTLFIGKVREHFEHLPSTNLYALEQLTKSNPLEGTIITTEAQTDGRGQIGSRWESEAQKNITLSVILYPKFLLARDQFWLNIAVSLGVLDFLQSQISDPQKVKIKWPNDIYVGRKKITGILIQNQINSSSIQSSVIGFGINVNQTLFLSDAPNPTSLKMETQKDYELEPLISVLCQNLEFRYLQLRNDNREKLKADYFHHLFQYQEECIYQDNAGKQFAGRIIGITPFGKLQIEQEKEVKNYEIKEIKFVL